MLPAHVTCNKNKSIRSNMRIFASPFFSRFQFSVSFLVHFALCAFERLKMRVNLVFSVKWVQHTVQIKICTHKKGRHRKRDDGGLKKAIRRENDKKRSERNVKIDLKFAK
jgi:hypothetical protein